MKKPAFPNEQFKSQQEYFDFVDDHPGYYGGAAYVLKKELDKQIIPLPRINPKYKLGE